MFMIIWVMRNGDRCRIHQSFADRANHCRGVLPGSKPSHSNNLSSSVTHRRISPSALRWYTSILRTEWGERWNGGVGWDRVVTYRRSRAVPCFSPNPDSHHPPSGSGPPPVGFRGCRRPRGFPGIEFLRRRSPTPAYQWVVGYLEGTEFNSPHGEMGNKHRFYLVV
jgi:hypothetical protein